MPTQRLYRLDPYLTTFTARVAALLTHEGRPAVTLEQTAFYPTAGGQPNDLGTLGGVAVVDVIETEDGEIIHVLAEPLPGGAVGREVEGVLDGGRRFDHMQQHTGQHILSAAFERALEAETVSFHLGAEASTIDLTLASFDEARANRVEDLANEVVFANAPVTATEYDDEQIKSLPLRKPPAVHGRIRIVRVGDFDLCACGGTHVRAAGEVGLIHIHRWEKRRGGTRIEFLCGWRALRDYRVMNRTAQGLAASLSVGIHELDQAVVRTTEAERTVRRQMDMLRQRLLDCELPRLAGEAEVLGGLRLVCRVLEGYDVGNMRYVAQNLVQTPGTVALLAVTNPSPQLCFAGAEDVSADMSALLREAAGPYGGRGGGRPHTAQGGGVTAEDLTAVLQAARARLTAVMGLGG